MKLKLKPKILIILKTNLNMIYLFIINSYILLFAQISNTK
jgi:hypothetical protein